MHLGVGFASPRSLLLVTQLLCSGHSPLPASTLADNEAQSYWVKACLFLRSHKETNTTELCDNPEGMGFQPKWRHIGAFRSHWSSEFNRDWQSLLSLSPWEFTVCIKSNNSLLMKYFMMGIVNYWKETFWSARIYDNDKFGQCLFKCLYEWTLPKSPQVLVTGRASWWLFLYISSDFFY